MSIRTNDFCNRLIDLFFFNVSDRPERCCCCSNDETVPSYLSNHPLTVTCPPVIRKRLPTNRKLTFGWFCI